MLNRRKFLSLSIGAAVAGPAIVNASANTELPTHNVDKSLQPFFDAIKSYGWSDPAPYGDGDIIKDIDGALFECACNTGGPITATEKV